MKQFLFGNYVGWDFDLNILLMHAHTLKEYHVWFQNVDNFLE